ncbi:hypothetical protein [Hymenobacter rubripertinctus]|uniref:DUF4136 domain-containing protein n=1 Tax=Hymenobacter rubripertinctus TaxID=2029981 RepID=A0A418QY54_9BACT|nr:hypothetical protein [Hymenobacter rubripertinctus]RIY10069.1 hypothetical protein D0T11_11055 [Hymenobacter rubripertinctus]
MNLRLLPAALALLLLAACSPKQYAGRTLDAPALAAHRTVAVLPFEVRQDRLRLRDIRYGGTDTSTAALKRGQQQWREEHQREVKATAYQLQQLLVAQLVAQQPAAGYSVQFQPVAETNRRLQQAGISYANLPEQSMAELQRVLGVDALLSGQTDLYQPLPAGVGLAAKVLLNQPVIGPSAIPPSQATTNLTLHDCRSGQLVWRFDYAATGQAALRPDRLTERLVKAVEPTFPYRQR